MHIVIVGAGAVGGYFGGMLARQHTDVTFLVRGKRYEQLSRDGLHVASPFGDISIRPRLARSVAEAGQPTVALLALKNYHLDAALPVIDELARQGTAILPLLNGVRHIDRLVHRYGQGLVLGGFCDIEVTLDTSGRIVHSSALRDLTFGALQEPQPPWLPSLESLMTQSGIEAHLSDAILVDMWKKFIFIVCLSSITAGLRQPIGVALSDPVTKSLLSRIIQEVTSVAMAHDIALPSDISDQMMARIEILKPSMTASLYRDMRNGLPLELDSLQGAVIELGRMHHVATPCVETIYGLLHPYQFGEITP